MKKVVFILLVVSAFFLISCGSDSDPVVENPDEDTAESDDQEAADSEDEGETDEDTVEEPDEPETDGDTAEEPDEPEQPEEDQNTPHADPIGDFSLNFTGQINTTISTSSHGGKGTTEFSYNGMDLSFGEISVMVVGDIFPLAMVNGGNIIVLWLDSFGMQDAMAAVEKQVFGIAVPQNAAAGSGTMKELGSYAFYGDIAVNIQGGQFDIKCVRAVSDSGEYVIDANDGANITFNANGSLFDPSLAGSMIPYPACTE